MEVEIEHHPDYLYVRMSGRYEGIFPTELHPSKLAEICRDGSYNCILADAREFVGKLGTMKRFELAKGLTKTSPLNKMRIAIVETSEREGRVSFFETVALNRGASLRVFTDIDKATQWLMR